MKKKRISEFLQRLSVGRRIFLSMRLTLGLTILLSVNVLAGALSQTVNLRLENATLREAFKAVKQQTGVYFVFNEEEVAREIKLNVVLQNATLERAMQQILNGLPYTFECLEGMVVIKPSEMAPQQREARVKIVKGKVTDSHGVPLPGVSVMMEGATRGCATDTEGRYSLVIENKPGVKLIFSFIGMSPETRVWNGEEKIDVKMYEAVLGMDEVVVTGYQTISRRESASAISSVKAEDIFIAGAPSVDQMLQGKIPGLMVMNTSGEPSATPKIRIRGNSTINGSKAPVWVVDGVILEQDVPFTASDLNSEDAEYLIGNAISGLRPQDIETITVLKDASATAIYGVKAANGVIVITTKKGAIGKPTVSYHGDVVMNQRPSYRNFDLMNSNERMQLSKEIFEDGLKYYSSVNLDPADSYEGLLNELINRRITRTEFADKALEMAGRNTDWFDVLFRNSVTHSHSLGVSGGTEKVRYYFSAGYNDNEGAAKGSSSERFTSLAKVNVQMNKWISFMTKFEYSTTKNKGYSSVNPFSYAYKTSRTVTPYNEDGSYHTYVMGGKYHYNVLKELENTGKDSKVNDFNGLLDLKVNLIKGLNYQGTFSFHNSNTNQREWQTEQSYAIALIRGYEYKQYDETIDDYWKSALPYGGILKQGDIAKNGYTVRNALNYLKVIDGVHDVNLFVGSEIRGNKYRGVSITGYGWTPEFGERFMPVNTTKFIENYAQAGRLNPMNTNSISRVASFFGTASYSYDNRYVFNFNIRSDGANKFGSNPKYRWLPTWSLAGKWNITNENFLSSFAAEGNYIGVRGSYGVQGNIHDDATPNLIIQIGNRNQVSNLDKSSIYRLPNPDLRWEKTTSWNAALDFTLFKGRLKGGVDVYKKHTEDLIMDKTVATSNGRRRLYINAGKMDNTGVEGFLNIGLIHNKLLDWRFNVNFGRNVNEVTLANDDYYNDLEEIQMMLDGNLAVEGEKVGSMFSYHFGGLSDKNGYPLFYGKDGKLYHGGDPTRMELVRSGSIFPDLAGGFDTQFTFKRRLSLGLGFTYSIGGVKRLPAVYDDKNRVVDPMANVSTNLKNRWRKTGDASRTDIPALYSDEIAGDFYRQGLMNVPQGMNLLTTKECTYFYDLSDERVAKADYLRLRLISLSYMVPEKCLNKVGISSMALRFQATNLHVWANKKWQGLDPETPEANIPLLPSYSFSIDVSF